MYLFWIGVWNELCYRARTPSARMAVAKEIATAHTANTSTNSTSHGRLDIPARAGESD